MNSVVSALRFFLTNTLDRLDLALLLNATTSHKHQVALSVAYGA